MTVSNTEITVILPCAGEGNRLGLRSPKELFEIVPGLRLIDFSLKHILAPKKENIAITTAVVIRPWKSEVAEYVSRQLPGLPVKTVFFNDNYKEWPGSVFSAGDIFSSYNLVLLPDTYLSLAKDSPLENPAAADPKGKTLVEMVIEALSRYKAVFGYVECREAKVLENLGAVKVEKGVVTVFQDKPRGEQLVGSVGQFNGFWGCYAFRKEMGKPLYDFLISSVLHRPMPLESQPFYPPGIVPIADYYDLGTWENIDRFKKLKISPRITRITKIGDW